jgi:energy-coupling factor transporter ATP-binding protein EcfA2
MTEQENREYLARISRGLTEVWERSIQRRVAIQSQEQDALTALLTRSPVLLVGDPGSGKTTLLEMVAFAAAKEHGAQGPVPFLLRASSCLLPSTPSDLAPWLLQLAKFDPPERLPQEVLDLGKGIILIDGLDELSPAHRDEAYRRLRRWLVEHPSNHWVFSSRPIGRPAFPDLAVEANLLDLSPDEISRATSLFVEDVKDAEELRRFVAAQPALASLATSPLFLGLIAQIFRHERRLPMARTDLYGSWTDIALRQWDKTRGIGRRSDFLSLDVTRHALSRLALRLVESSRFHFDLSDWFAAVRGFLEVDDAAWQTSELTFRENLLGSGLVRSVSPTEFAFAHLTLQEYFASQALLREDPSDALRIIERIPFDGVAAFYADVAPDPMRAARFFVSAGRLDDVRRLLDAFPRLARSEREEIVLLIAQRLGVDHVSFQEAPDNRSEPLPSDAKDSLRILWRECRTADSPNERGRAFEEFTKALFGSAFKVVDMRRLTSFGEIDLICEVKADSFWIRWPGDCFVECKNLQDSVPVGVANEFVGKCSTVRVGLAFLVCAGTLTEPARERVSRSWTQAEGPDMAWIDGTDIDKWLAEPVDAESLLKRVVRRASYGTQ